MRVFIKRSLYFLSALALMVTLGGCTAPSGVQLIEPVTVPEVSQIPEETTSAGPSPSDAAETAAAVTASTPETMPIPESVDAVPVASKTDVTAAEVFGQLPKTLWWSNGDREWWGISVHVNPDGSFTAQYSVPDPDQYPGPMYVCDMTGSFTGLAPAGEYEYRLMAENVTTDGHPGETYDSDGTTYIRTEAQGFADGDSFRLFMPGYLMTELPEGWLSWPFSELNAIIAEDPETIPTGMYVLYNETQNIAYVGAG